VLGRVAAWRNGEVGDDDCLKQRRHHIIYNLSGWSMIGSGLGVLLCILLLALLPAACYRCQARRRGWRVLDQGEARGAIQRNWQMKNLISWEPTTKRGGT
jgi:hypothetical protein